MQNLFGIFTPKGPYFHHLWLTIILMILLSRRLGNYHRYGSPCFLIAIGYQLILTNKGTDIYGCLFLMVNLAPTLLWEIWETQLECGQWLQIYENLICLPKSQYFAGSCGKMQLLLMTWFKNVGFMWPLNVLAVIHPTFLNMWLVYQHVAIQNHEKSKIERKGIRRLIRAYIFESGRWPSFLWVLVDANISRFK